MTAIYACAMATVHAKPLKIRRDKTLNPKITYSFWLVFIPQPSTLNPKRKPNTKKMTKMSKKSKNRAKARLGGTNF